MVAVQAIHCNGLFISGYPFPLVDSSVDSSVALCQGMCSYHLLHVKQVDVVIEHVRVNLLPQRTFIEREFRRHLGRVGQAGVRWEK